MSAGVAGRPRAAARRAADLEKAVRQTGGVQPWRRLFHAAGGLALVAFVQVTGPESGPAVAGIGAALAAALLLDWARLRFVGANTAFFRMFSRLASPREASRIASSTWYLAGALAVLVIFPPRLFIPSILVLAFADPAASVVGRLWGRRRLGKGTWEGTGVFFLVSAGVLIPLAGVGAGLFAAAVAAAAEVLPTGLDDNVVVPASAALALWLAGVPI